eukprot:1937677-Rhodomonas_salina.6
MESGATSEAEAAALVANAKFAGTTTLPAKYPVLKVPAFALVPVKFLALRWRLLVPATDGAKEAAYGTCATTYASAMPCPVLCQRVVLYRY